METTIKQKNIAFAITLTLAAIFLIGWVLPSVPYINRISKEKANSLLDEFEILYLKNWNHVNNNSNPALTSDESKRWTEIKSRLIKAGYNLCININESTSSVESTMDYPSYVS